MKMKGTDRHVSREGGEVLDSWGPDWQVHS